MPPPVSRSVPAVCAWAAGFLIGALLAYASTSDVGLAHHRSARRRATRAVLLDRWSGGSPPPRRNGDERLPSTVNVEVDARDPALLAAHVHLLVTRPFLQRVPYRDREIAVTLAGVGGDDKPLLTVRYRATIGSARREMRHALGAAHDPGSEYELRYAPLPR